MNEYETIIHFGHYEPRYHPRMSMENRSAQFSPFAALTGYEQIIHEVARRVDSYKELTEEEQSILDQKFQYLLAHLSESLIVTIVYFQKDPWKEGGSYLHHTGVVKKIDFSKNLLLFQDSFRVSLTSIFDILLEDGFMIQ